MQFMANRIRSLLSPPEKELVLELERMRMRYGICGKDRSPSRLDAFVKSLEEERDYYRREAEKYRRTRGGGRASRSPSLSPARGRSPRTRAGWHGRVRKSGHTLLHRIQVPKCCDTHMQESLKTFTGIVLLASSVL